MSSVAIPLSFQRYQLPLKAVLLRCLDDQKRPLCTASGFLRREGSDLFLYTCWHVVTGYDKNDLRVGHQLPNRIYLEINMQDAQTRQPGVTVIGGLQSIVVPLYDEAATPRKPLWFQDSRHIPNSDLNAIGLFVPFWHDAVKIKLPADVRVTDMQVIDESNVFPGNTNLIVGDKLYVVGYPYGFSAFGGEQPTPVVLTRHVAATLFGGRLQEALLDGAGAPSMSGGPVFVERDTSLHLLGMYTGLIYPDYAIEANEKVTALGTCSNLSLSLWGDLPLVQEPSES